MYGGGVRTRPLRAALFALVILFVVALVLGEVVARPADNVASPSRSRLRYVEDVFPPRRLTVEDISRGGPTCLQGTTFVVGPGGGCTFILPKGVHVVEFRRVPGSPGMTVTLDQTGELTQNVDTGLPGPTAPLRLRLATVHNGATVTLSLCRGPGPCRLDLIDP